MYKIYRYTNEGPWQVYFILLTSKRAFNCSSKRLKWSQSTTVVIKVLVSLRPVQPRNSLNQIKRELEIQATRLIFKSHSPPSNLPSTPQSSSTEWNHCREPRSQQCFCIQPTATGTRPGLGKHNLQKTRRAMKMNLFVSPNKARQQRDVKRKHPGHQGRDERGNARLHCESHLGGPVLYSRY